MGAQGVAGLEDLGQAGVGLQHPAEPVGQDGELAGPAQGGIQAQVDLGQHGVQDQVLEALFVADMVVQGPGDDPQAGGQAAHGQGLEAVVGDDGQGLGDHLVAAELGAAVLGGGGGGRTTATASLHRSEAGPWPPSCER
jgi:hypothetical protein